MPAAERELERKKVRPQLVLANEVNEAFAAIRSSHHKPAAVAAASDAVLAVQSALLSRIVLQNAPAPGGVFAKACLLRRPAFSKGQANKADVSCCFGESFMQADRT